MNKQPSSNDPSDTDPNITDSPTHDSAAHDSGAAAKKSLLMTVLAPLLVGAVLLGGWYFYSTQKQAAIELEAKAALSELGAFPQLDAKKHVSTLMLRQNLDEAMPWIAKLRYLTNLDVSDTEFDDEDAKQLQNQSRLISLVVSNTNITDQGVEYLTGLPLENLMIAGTPITPKGLESLTKMSTLQVIDLARTDVASDLSPLTRMNRLERVQLDDVDLSSVEQEAAETFRNIPNLLMLTLNRTGMSQQTISRLKSDLPRVTLTASSASPEQHN